MKLALKVLGIIVALILVAILALVLLFDLNMLKPRIEAAAREQGISLQIGGDLGWTFWPSVGVTVEDIRVAGLEAPDQLIAQLKQASLLVALTPLFSGDIQVHHVRVDGAVINLAVDKQGTGNWEALTADKPTAAPTETGTAGEPSTAQRPSVDGTPTETQKLKLAIERVSLLNSSLSYRDEQSGQIIVVDDIQLDIRQFNLQGQPFDMSLALKTTVSDDAQPANPATMIALELANRARLSPDFEQLQLSSGELKLTINSKGSVTARYSVNVEDLQENLRFSGDLKVPAFNAKALLSAMGSELKTVEKNALTAVALDAHFVGDKTHMTLEPLKIHLDKTTIEGRLAVADFETGAIQVALNGDQINIDEYLAQPVPETQAAASAAGSDEILIPLDTVRGLDLEARAGFAKVTVANMPLENIQLRLNAKNGLVNVQQADARLYDGSITNTGSLDGRGDTAAIRFDSKINGVQLAPAMKDLALDEKIKFSGAINANATGNLRGVTMNQLMDSLVAEANIAGDEVRFSPLNIEQKFCQLVNLVNQVDDPQGVWENFTEMRQLSGKITMAQRVVNVESFNAGVHQLVLGTQGKINLHNDEYDFILPLKLLEEETSENGCRVAGNYWINRSLSLLRCKGSLASLNPVQDCRPDSKGLASLTKDFAEYKIREKHGDKIDAAEQRLDEKKQELLNKLDKKLGGSKNENTAEGEKAGETQKPGDLLKGLLKKRAEKTSPPAADTESTVPADATEGSSEIP